MNGLLIDNPELVTEFTNYITERRERALEEAMKYDNFLATMIRKPAVAQQPAIAKAIEHEIVRQPEAVVAPVQEPIVPLTQQEIVNHVKGLLGTQPFMVQGKIIEQLRTKGKRWQNIEPHELNSVLGMEVRNQNNSIKRFIIGEKSNEKVYTYALTTTHVPNNDVLYYNADAHPGCVAFNNMRNVLMKNARTFTGDFTPTQIVNKIITENPHMKMKDKRNFMNGTNTTLGQLAKMGKLSTSGSHKDRTYRVS